MTDVLLLNIDAGELPGESPELYQLADIVNVAVGGHAGDAVSIARAVSLAKAAGARLFAHPSFPDREHFGRRPMTLPAAVLTKTLEEQLLALRDAASGAGLAVEGIKAHGALYHAADGDPALAALVVDVGRRLLGPTFAVIGPPGGALARAAAHARARFLAEAFADRGVRADGSLIARGEPGALIAEPAAAAARANVLVRGGRVDTICVHGDMPSSLSVARAVRAELDAAVRPP